MRTLITLSSKKSVLSRQFDIYGQRFAYSHTMFVDHSKGSFDVTYFLNVFECYTYPLANVRTVLPNNV